METQKTLGAARLISLFDEGTFVGIGQRLQRPGETEGYNGVVCGYGAIGGKLAFAFAQDKDFLSGALDEIGAKKIGLLYDEALKNGAPIVGLFDGAGAVVEDGASALGAYASVIRHVTEASGIVPQIALIAGVCAGSAAVIAELFDAVITVDGKSELFVNAPFNTGIKEKTSDVVYANGLSSVNTLDEASAIEMARRLVAFLPSNRADGIAVNTCLDDVNRLVNADVEDARALVETLADAGSAVEFCGGFGKDTLTYLASLGGVTVGVIASDPAVHEGKISPDGAKKATRMISFCDAFSIPVITLIHSTGVVPCAEAEKAGFASVLASLTSTYAAAVTPKISVVTGKAYGAAYTLLGSKELGTDMAYALEGAQISTMEPAAAVAFLWNDLVSRDVSREALEKKWIEKYALAERAAEKGLVDDLISPAEMRQRIISALYMLMRKSDGVKTRRHSVRSL